MTWTAAPFAAIPIAVLAVLSAVVVLQQRRTPQSAAAWLLFIVFLPYLAIPFFVILGFRKRTSRFEPIAFDTAVDPRPDQTVARDAVVPASYGIPAATGGNSLKIVRAGEEAFVELIRLCRSARTDLQCLFYLVADDAVGQAFVEELIARAEAGVSVRLLLDRLGNLKPPRRSLDALKAAGGEVRYFSPLLQLPERGHLNLRNHRKMVIADGARVFAGGMNVGTEYMGPDPSPDRWTDLAYLIEGPAVATFRDVFRSDWGTTGGALSQAGTGWPGTAAGGARVQLVPSGPDTAGDPLHDTLVNAIHSARRRVWLATPYFLPTEFLGNALSIAAKRRVDVRVLLPQKSNQKLADFARGAYLHDMQDAGCRIEFFQGGMLHAKAGIIDDIGYLGSANFDVRSMLLNFETTLFVYDPGSVQALADWYRLQEERCTSGLPPAGFFRRISEGVFRLGAPVL